MNDPINIRMLGGFSLEYNGKTVSDDSNRMRKVWLLLAYLIFNRGRRTGQDQYLSLLQTGGSEDAADPNGRIKALFYRARTMINQLEPQAGHKWILHRAGSYSWNSDEPLTLDAEEFESLCRQAAACGDPEQQLVLYRQALALYRGDFLPKLGMEPWVMPLQAYYHQMYLEAAEQALALMARRGLWSEMESLCAAALRIEPYSEVLFQHQIRCRIALGDRNGARQIYEDMSELLFATFGVMPSEESRALYREAGSEEERVTVPADTVREQLREPFGARGAMLCDYDFFRLFYQLQARTIVRSGDVIHIALFSVHGAGGETLSRRSLDRVMENLQELLVNNLRQGDVVTRCSVSQFIIMLPQANYEDSTMVCQRLLKAFRRKYPHSPAEIRCSVQPLEPRMPDKT